MNPKLVVVGGEVNPKEISLKLPTVIGRGRNVTLSLPQQLISRRHCEIYQKHGKLMVRDLGSLNGTFVDNEKIDSEHVLLPNQLLTVGSVTFRAIYDSAANQVNRPTQYDDVASRETVGRSKTDTDKLDTPLPERTDTDPDVVETIRQQTANKPRSNPRPQPSIEVSETIATHFNPAEIRKQ